MAETEKKQAGVSWPRFLFWEILAAVGLYHIILFTKGPDWRTVVYFYNALVFLAAFPLLVFYKRFRMPGFLTFLLFPLGLVLSATVLVSGFYWISYLLFIFHSPLLLFWTQNYILAGIMYLLFYFALFKHLLGIGNDDYRFGDLVLLLITAGAGAVAGFFFGKWFDEKWGPVLHNPTHRMVLWMAWVFLGLIIGATMGHKPHRYE